MSTDHITLRLIFIYSGVSQQLVEFARFSKICYTGILNRFLSI